MKLGRCEVGTTVQVEFEDGCGTNTRDSVSFHLDSTAIHTPDTHTLPADTPRCRNTRPFGFSCL